MNSIKLFKIFGITLELHSSFVWLTLIGLVYLFFFQPNDLFNSIVFFFLLFSSVFFHELTHSLTALFFKIKVEKIILLPIGGVALTKNNAKKPLHEFLIALSGPLFNFSLIFLISLIVSINPNIPFWPSGLFAKFSSGLTPSVEEINFALMNFPLFALVWINFFLGAFNLFIPAFPMDGGRILRAILNSFTSFEKATIISSKVSKFIAFLMFLTGFFIGNIFLIIIAVFVFFAAVNELQVIEVKQTLGSKTIESILEPAIIIDGSTPLIEAIDLMKEKNLNSILIQTNNSFHEFNINSIPTKNINLSKPVKEFSTKTPLIKENTKAQKILNYFQNNPTTTLPVQTKQKTIKQITKQQLQNYYNLQKTEKKIKKMN